MKPATTSTHAPNEKKICCRAPVQQANPVVQAIVAAPHDRHARGSGSAQLSLVKVGEAHDRQSADEGNAPQDDEGRPVGEPIELEDHVDHDEGGQGAPCCTAPSRPMIEPLFAAVVRVMVRAV